LYARPRGELNSLSYSIFRFVCVPHIEPLALAEDEIDDLVPFMASLTGSEYKEIGIKELARQRGISRTSRTQRDTARAFGRKPARPKAEDLLHDSQHP
jgi:hypothetical protein